MRTTRLSPIYYIVFSWFAGSVLAFLCFEFPLKLILVLFILAFVVSLFRFANLFKAKILRGALVSSWTLLFGALHFCLNDYRHEDHQSSGDFLVKVTEAKMTTSETQLLKIHTLKQEKNHKFLKSEFDAIVSIQSPTERYIVDDILAISGDFEKIENKGNPGEFNASWYYLTKGIRYRMFLSGSDVQKVNNEWSVHGMFVRWKNYLAQLMAEHLEGDFLGVAQALILGDKENLSGDVMKSFSNTGAMHVLAVSGLHVGLILVMINKILSFFSRYITKRNSLVFSILLIWIYGFITGASPAVMRAVFMFSVVAIGTLIEKKSSGLLSLAVSAIVLSLTDPWVIFDIGFQLSFLAMLGVFLLYPKIKILLQPKNKYLLWFWDGNAVGLAATAFTTPLTLFYFYQFPNYFLLANIGVMLFGTFVLLSGVIFLISSPIPVVSAITALVFCFGVLGLLLWVAWVEKLPGAISGGFHLSFIQLMFALLFVSLFALFELRKWSAYLWFGVLVLVVSISLQRSGELNRQELILLNSNEFVAVLKTDNGSVGFYSPKYGHANLPPKILDDYQRYSGLKMRLYSIEKNMKFKLGNEKLIIKKSRFGYTIQLNQKHFFYQTYGQPLKKKNSLYNQKLFQYVYNKMPAVRIFKL